MVNIGVGIAIFSVVCWTAYNILAKKGAVNLGNRKTAIIITGAGIIPMAIILAIYGFQWPGFYPIILSIIAGICIAFGNFFNYKSLETEQVTKIGALGEISAVLVTIYGFFVLHNPLNTIEEASILLIFIGSFFIMSNEHIEINKKLLPALIGNILWAAYWILMTIAITSSSTFQLQMFTSRSIGFVALLLLIYFVGLKKPDAKKEMKHSAYVVIVAITALAGLVDGLGDGMFGLTLHLNVVAAGGAIAATAPMFISIAAYFFYKERLRKLELIGLITVIVGAVALALF